MRVTVVGGGIAGLAAALALRAEHHDVTLVEAAPRVGGCLRTTRVGEFTFDDGPNSIPGDDVAFAWLIKELQLESQLVHSKNDAAIRWLYHKGSLCRVPSSPWQMLTSPLMGLRGLMALRNERSIPPRMSGAPETVDAFLRRRFGDRLTDTFADAVIAGIYGGDPRALGIEEGFPDVVSLERRHGSIVKGLGARRRAMKGTRIDRLVSHRDGLGAVADAARNVLGDSVLLNTEVVGVDLQMPAAPRVHVTSPAGSRIIESEGLILATPAATTLSLIQSALPDRLGVAAPRMASMAVVQLGFHSSTQLNIPRGFGWLVPRSERLRTLGCMVVTNIFPARGPQGSVGLQVFFGGSLDPEAVSLQDEALAALAERELHMILKSTSLPKPQHARVVRWRDAIPQPMPGDARHHADLRTVLARVAPRVAVTGSWIDGVSVGRCIQGGRAAALHVSRTASA